MSKELWLPTTTTHAQVNGSDVKVWDDVTFELRKVKTPAGLATSGVANPADTLFKPCEAR